MSTNLQDRPVTADEQHYLDILDAAEKRESTLEALYVEGQATAAQLAELEQVRMVIEDTLEGLDVMGYFNPQ